MKRRKSESDEEGKNPNPSTRIPTETIPEAIVVEILARLPLRSIARFKSVCEIWKSVIESPYLRRRFDSVHESSSSSWSLMFGIRYPRPITEAISFHGCKRWGLPKSLASYIVPFQPYPNRRTSMYSYVASSNGLVLIDVFVVSPEDMTCQCYSFVGNPVLQQWFQIPQPPEPSRTTGLVTRLGDDGAVSSFKVVMTCGSRYMERYAWSVCVYSSLTGLWTCQQLLNFCPFSYESSYPSIDINGMLYLYSTKHQVLIAHDFYADDKCRVMPLHVPVGNHKRFRRCVTTSGRDVFLIEVTNPTLIVWRLNSSNGDEESWELLREEIIMETVDCFPMAMDPFDSDVIYLWSYQHGCLVSTNLRTDEFIVHQESENVVGSICEGGCVVSTSSSKEYMESRRNLAWSIMLSQFVLPQWMDPVPRPLN